MARLPTYFISHGGGPWPWLPDMRKGMATLEASLAAMPSELPEKPKAILMISGHWEQDDFAVMGATNPPMVYDYGGFPAFTYQIKYSAPGAPVIAARVVELLKVAGLPTHLNTTQGFDHGVFAPMQIMYPEANVPLFKLFTERLPVTPVDKGKPVAFVSVADVGVPNIGAVNVSPAMVELVAPKEVAVEPIVIILFVKAALEIFEMVLFCTLVGVVLPTLRLIPLKR